MKKYALTAALFFALMSGQAQAAGWQDDFVEDYDKFGLDVAVENALAEDIKPQAIMAYVVKNREKFNTDLSLKAIYCAGVDVDIVERAGIALGIPNLVVKRNLEASIKECGSKVALTDRDIVEPPHNGRLSEIQVRRAVAVTRPAAPSETAGRGTEGAFVWHGTEGSLQTVPPEETPPTVTPPVNPPPITPPVTPPPTSPSSPY